jgi:hypothetical protein
MNSHLTSTFAYRLNISGIPLRQSFDSRLDTDLAWISCNASSHLANNSVFPISIRQSNVAARLQAVHAVLGGVVKAPEMTFGLALPLNDNGANELGAWRRAWPQNIGPSGWER